MPIGLTTLTLDQLRELGLNGFADLPIDAEFNSVTYRTVKFGQLSAVEECDRLEVTSAFGQLKRIKGVSDGV